MTQTNLADLSRLISRMMDYCRIPGCAIAVIDGAERHFLSFGTRDAETGAPFTAETVSGIGSCTKSMTSAAAMILAGRGVLDLDRPISSYGKNFKLWDAEATERATLRDLFCHRTGVAGHDGTWPDNRISRVDFLSRLRCLEPNAPFRSVAQYSNVMYAAAGGVMEYVTGKKWERILAEEIFEPLGMEHTYCLMGDAEREENLARPHFYDGALRAAPRWNIDMAGPCGSVMSTAEDMARWLAWHIAGGAGLLSEKGFADLHTPQIPMDYPHVAGGTNPRYALGWRVLDYHGHEVQQHTGKIEGYSAFQFYLPAEGKGAVYLQNLHVPDNPFIFAVQGFLLDAFLGREEADWEEIYTEGRAHAPKKMYTQFHFDYTPKEKPSGNPPRPLEAYEGAYENGGYGIFRIEKKGSALVLWERDVEISLTHWSGDTFIAHDVKEDTDFYTLPLTFSADETGKVSGFTLPMEPRVEEIKFVIRNS